ncbi:MAG TPA: hypothetical protein VGK73_39530, partial [Polyangiaceae bacterium]
MLTCGCLDEGTLMPAGTPCIVEACSGSEQAATCDGMGQCGIPNCAPIPGACTDVSFGGSTYWICEGPV